MENWKKRVPASLTVATIAILLSCAITYAGYKIYKKFMANSDNLAVRITELETHLAKFQSDFSIALESNKELADKLANEQAKSGDLVEKLDDISDTVGVLEKLRTTDKELLQKYSKVYFLNEHYVPIELENIPSKYAKPTNTILKIHADVWPHLEDLLDDAQSEDLDLQVLSAYRSFGEQSAIKTSYKIIYGVGTANQFSADQGYSEHQLGTTVDFSTPALGVSLSSDAFAKTNAYPWLLENAYRYGFVLSYPEGNSYYQFEPWHWRFVGKDLARRLHNSKMHFYDMDQRIINEYLPDIFDQ